MENDDGSLGVRRIAERFEELCTQLFAFLMDQYGFSPQEIARTTATRTVNFVNQSTGVSIRYQPRDGGVFIVIARLSGKKFPPAPLFVGEDAVLESFDFVDLIRLRGGCEVKQGTDDCYDLGKIKHLLDTYSREMQRLASDVLSGDFSVFADLDRIVKNRISYLRKEF